MPLNRAAAVAPEFRRRRLSIAGGWGVNVAHLATLLSLHAGAILIGPPGAGKSIVWRVLLAALNTVTAALGEGGRGGSQRHRVRPARASVLDS